MRKLLLPIATLTLLLGCSDGAGTGSAQQSGGSDAVVSGGDGSGAGPAADAATPADGATSPDVAATTDAAQTTPKCKANEDCDAGEVCDCRGACVPAGVTPCEEDKNCGATATNYCDTCTGFCATKKKICEPCGGTLSSASGGIRANKECEKDGSACLDFAGGGKFCGRICLEDVGCPKGFVCEPVPNAEKQCVPVSGSCETPGECAKDADCTFPKICNQDLLVCADGCPDDDSCPNGKVCTAGHCVPPCASPADCEAGEECNDGHCKVPGGCTSSYDCPNKETYCDLAQKMCVPGCQTDFDCKEFSKQCTDGKCVEKGCPGNFYCGFSQVCNFSTGKCEDAVGPYCDACDQENDSECGGGNNLCIGFTDEEENDLGDFCLVECGPDPDNPCPQGYACDEIDLGDGDVRHLCTRNCPVPPVGSN